MKVGMNEIEKHRLERLHEFVGIAGEHLGDNDLGAGGTSINSM